MSIPLLGFGTWQLRGKQAYDAVRHALDVGYRLIDTATIYHNESEVGRAIRDSGVAGDEVFITTKVPVENHGRERPTLEASRRALGVDSLDLWLIHWPPGGRASVEMWRELVSARYDGLTRSAGVSNYSPAQLDQLIDATGETPALNQIRWSPRVYDPDRVAHSRDRGVVLEGYSPFKASHLNNPVLREVADSHGVTPAQVVLRWHVDHDVVVIPKSATPERIAANFDVFGFELSAEELKRIDALRER